MIAFQLLAVSTVLLAYRNVQVKCDGEEGWTNAHNPVDEIIQEHSTEPSHNGQGWNNEEQAEHSNVGVTPSNDGGHNAEHDSSGIGNTVTESSNGNGMRENPMETNSQSPTNDKDREQAEHNTEVTASESRDLEHQHPSPPNQWSSEATTEGEGHGWTNGNDLQGNNQTESSGVTPSTDSHDEHGENLQQADTTPGGDHRWNNTEDPQGQWSGDSGGSQMTTSIHGQQTESWDTDTAAGGNHGWNNTDEHQGYLSNESSDLQVTTSNENHNEHSHGLTVHDYISPGGTTPSTDSRDEHGENHQQTVSWGTDMTPGDEHSSKNTEDPQGHWSTESGDSQTTIIHGQTENWNTDTTPDGDHRWNSTDNPHGHTEPWGSETTLAGDRSPTNIDTTMASEGRPDGSGTLTASRTTRQMGLGTSQYSDVTTTSDDNDYSWRNDNQGPTTSSYDDSISHSPPHYDDPQFDGQSPPPDYDQATLGNDYGEIPEDDTDEAGNELVAGCKKESNYQGDFHDPNESSTELKCFYACAMVKMDVMNEDNGQMQLNMQTTVNTIEDAFGDNTEMIEKYKNAVSACDQEVQRGGDRCEYAFNIINCGIQKVQAN